VKFLILKKHKQIPGRRSYTRLSKSVLNAKENERNKRRKKGKNCRKEANGNKLRPFRGTNNIFNFSRLPSVPLLLIVMLLLTGSSISQELPPQAQEKEAPEKITVENSDSRWREREREASRREIKGEREGKERVRGPLMIAISVTTLPHASLSSFFSPLPSLFSSSLPFLLFFPCPFVSILLFLHRKWRYNLKTEQQEERRGERGGRRRESLCLPS